MPRKKGQRKKASERKPRNKHERKAAESRLRREKQKRKAPGDAEEIKISKYFGVYWEKTGWVARFVANGQLYVWPDTFETELEAAHAVNNGCDILGIKRKIPSIDRKIDQKTSKNKNDEVGRNITEKQRKPKPPYIKTREPLPEEKPIKPKKSDGPVSCEYCGEDSSSKRLHFNKERTMKLCFACYSYEWTNGFLVPRVDRNGSRKSKRAAIENAGNEESESVESDSDESETDQSSSDESDTKEADIFRADMDVDDLNEKGESKVQKEASEMKSGNKEVEHFKVKEKKLWKKRKGSSNYFGVSWHSGKGKWQAQFKHEGFTRWCGAYSKELCAARAINRKCDEYGIPHKNPGIGAEDTTVMQVAVESSDDDEIFTVTKRQFSRMKGKGSSKYLGVSWYAKNGKWRAQFRVEGEIIWCGWHTSELDAVRAINKKCDELGIEPRNVYTGTTKSTESATELDEAHGANRKCDELEIGRKNQDTGHPSLKSHVHLDRDEDKTICQYHGCLQESANGRLYKSTMTDSLLCVACKRYEERTGFLTPRAQRNKGSRPKDMNGGNPGESTYVGVSKNSRENPGWKANIWDSNRQKSVYLGLFESQLDAAKAVNARCKLWGIPLKNPELEPDFPKRPVSKKKMKRKRNLGIEIPAKRPKRVPKPDIVTKNDSTSLNLPLGNSDDVNHNLESSGQIKPILNELKNDSVETDFVHLDSQRMRLEGPYASKEFWGSHYETQTRLSNLYDWFCFPQEAYKVFSRFLPKKETTKVLEMGCGNSPILKVLEDKRNFVDLTGADFCQTVITELQKTPGSKIKYEVQDAKSTTFLSETFDVIISKGLLDAIDCGRDCEVGADNFEEIVDVAEEMHRILKFRGIWIIITMCSINKRLEFLIDLESNYDRKFKLIKTLAIDSDIDKVNNCHCIILKKVHYQVY